MSNAKRFLSTKFYAVDLDRRVIRQRPFNSETEATRADSRLVIRGSRLNAMPLYQTFSVVDESAWSENVIHARPLSPLDHLAPCGARISRVLGEDHEIQPSSSGEPGHRDITCRDCMHVQSERSRRHRARLRRPLIADGCTDPDDEHADCETACGLVGCDPKARRSAA